MALQNFSLNLGAAPGSTVGYASGTTATMLALTGTDGMLFWNTTYKAMFMWTADRWSCMYVDSRYGFNIYDDWLSGNSISAFAWTVSGTQVYNAAISDVAPGTMTVRQASASSISTIRSSTANLQFGTMDLYYDASIIIPSLATVAEDFSVAVGVHDNASYSATSSCTDGIYFCYDRATTGDFWVTNTTSNGTNTPNVVTAVSANTFMRLGFILSTDQSVKFYINNTLVSTHTTNIPTGSARVSGFNFCINKTAGTGNSDMAVDFVRVSGFFNGARVA